MKKQPSCQALRSMFLGHVRDARFFRQEARKAKWNSAIQKDHRISAGWHVTQARTILRLIKNKGCPVPKGKVGIY